MGGCRCSYKNCKSSTKRTENLHFFHYPVKHKDRCALWIKNANKPYFNELPDDQLRNKVICGLHFEDKCFTNLHRNRLVLDAVPNIDGESDDSDSIAEVVKDVEVFPTSADGSTFTLQTEHLHPGSSNTEVKYGFRNGNISVHNFDSVSEVYTIDPLYIQQPFYSSHSSNNVFINSNNMLDDTISEESINVKEDIISKEQEDRNLLTQVLDDFITPDIERTVKTCSDDNVSYNDIKKPKRNGLNIKNSCNKQLIKQMSRNSYEISKIKKCLSEKYIKLSKKKLLNLLRGRLPKTLLGAVSLALSKPNNKLTGCEKEFLQTMYDISPTALNVLKRKGWFVPKQIVVERKFIDNK